MLNHALRHKIRHEDLPSCLDDHIFLSAHGVSRPAIAKLDAVMTTGSLLHSLVLARGLK